MASTSKDKDKDKGSDSEVRLSGGERPMGPQEGDPVKAASANVRDQLRQVREAEAEHEANPDAPPVDVFDAPVVNSEGAPVEDSSKK